MPARFAATLRASVHSPTQPKLIEHTKTGVWAAVPGPRPLPQSHWPPRTGVLAYRVARWG
ncbi:hypothetical protein [Nocardia sp. NPDC049707]|uniref:hypothetical protein n=1 Tax=Nocardia sp. NPDC049707 TaxID=3154735 RepID=UPI003415F4F5